MITLNGRTVTPTIFPDRTSQVWKVEGIGEANYVVWWFEDEAELIHLQQLAKLLRHQTPGDARLMMPYLPYARQDKPVGNDATFALNTFADALNAQHWDRLLCFDAHSRMTCSLIERLVSYPPTLDFLDAYDVVVFADTGAAERYGSLVKPGKSQACGHKVRDPATGRITSYELRGDDVRGKSVIVLDDLCDGGATFQILGDALHAGHAAESHLYVTHGVFSKGLEGLMYYYNTVITTNTVRHTKERYPFWGERGEYLNEGRLEIRKVVS